MNDLWVSEEQWPSSVVVKVTEQHSQNPPERAAALGFIPTADAARDFFLAKAGVAASSSWLFTALLLGARSMLPVALSGAPPLSVGAATASSLPLEVKPSTGGMLPSDAPGAELLYPAPPTTRDKDGTAAAAPRAAPPLGLPPALSALPGAGHWSRGRKSEAPGGASRCTMQASRRCGLNVLLRASNIPSKSVIDTLATCPIAVGRNRSHALCLRALLAPPPFRHLSRETPAP